MSTAGAEPCTEPWLKLIQELQKWRAQDWEAKFWWRDDDAIAVTPELNTLIDVVTRHEVPVGLSVIPTGAEAKLANEVADRPLISVLQHGIAHLNHSAPGAVAHVELGGTRSVDDIAHDLAAASVTMRALFGPKLLPVLVPPWNQIDETLVTRLPELGFKGLSSAGARRRRAEGLIETNAHINPIKWSGTVGSFAGSDAPMRQTLRQLTLRREGRIDRDEPIGFVTHHLAMDEDTWSYVECFLAVSKDCRGVRWLSPREAFELN